MIKTSDLIVGIKDNNNAIYEGDFDTARIIRGLSALTGVDISKPPHCITILRSTLTYLPYFILCCLIVNKRISLTCRFMESFCVQQQADLKAFMTVF